MIFIILGARDQDIQNKREPCTAIRRNFSQIQNDLTVFMKGQSFQGAHGPLAPLAPCPACIPFKEQPCIPSLLDGGRAKPFELDGLDDPNWTLLIQKW